jgi:hypothetical protein
MVALKLSIDAIYNLSNKALLVVNAIAFVKLLRGCLKSILINIKTLET